MSKSDALETDVLNYWYRGVAHSTVTSNSNPGSVWVALFNGDPTDAGSGGVELDYTGYARAEITRATGSWAAPANNGGAQRITNAAAVNWPASTGGGSQTATHVAYMTAATGGTMLHSAAMAASQVITVGGAAPTAAIGALTISES